MGRVTGHCHFIASARHTFAPGLTALYLYLCTVRRFWRGAIASILPSELLGFSQPRVTVLEQDHDGVHGDVGPTAWRLSFAASDTSVLDVPTANRG